MRGKALERRRIDDVVGAVESPEIAGQAVAHIEIAICEFDGEIRRDPVSETCMKRPGEIPFRQIVAECQPRQYAGAGDAEIGEVRNRDPRPAGAGADERRYAPPGAEVDIGVGESEPFGFGGVIGVSAEATGEADEVKTVEIRIAAILAGNIPAEPGVEPITDAKAEDTRGVKGQVLAGRSIGGVERVIQPLDALIAESDIAPQIPPAEILDRRRDIYWRRRDGHVRSERHRRQQGCRSGGNQTLN